MQQSFERRIGAKVGYIVCNEWKKDGEILQAQGNCYTLYLIRDLPFPYAQMGTEPGDLAAAPVRGRIELVYREVILDYGRVLPLWADVALGENDEIERAIMAAWHARGTYRLSEDHSPPPFKLLLAVWSESRRTLTKERRQQSTDDQQEG